MHRTLLILSLLASGAAASAHAQTAFSTTSATVQPAVQVQAPKHRLSWLHSPVTADQAEALLCPRWNCDAEAIDKAFKASNPAPVAVVRPAAAPQVETVATATVRTGAM